MLPMAKPPDLFGFRMDNLLKRRATWQQFDFDPFEDTELSNVSLPEAARFSQAEPLDFLLIDYLYSYGDLSRLLLFFLANGAFSWLFLALTASFRTLVSRVDKCRLMDYRRNLNPSQKRVSEASSGEETYGVPHIHMEAHKVNSAQKQSASRRWVNDRSRKEG